MRCIGYLLMYLLVNQTIIAQSDSLQVLEIPAIYPTDNFLLNSLGKNGLILSKPLKSSVLQRKNEWQFYKLNTNFQYLDSITIAISPKLYLVGKTQYQHTIYYLFYNYKREEIQVLELNSFDFTYKIYELWGIKNLLISGFVVVDGACYLTGTLRRVPMVLYFHLNHKQPRIKALSTSMTRKSQLASLNVDAEKNEIYLAIMHQKYRHFALKIKTFDLQTAEIKTEYMVYDAKEPILLDAKLKIVGDTHYFSGLYSQTFRNLPEGFFVAKFQEGKSNFMKFYRYADLENFFRYLPDKQEDKIKKQRRNYQNYAPSMRALIRRPFLVHDTIYVVGEAYYPIYRQDNPLDQFSMWRTPVRAGSISEGFVYTHGFMVALDQNGNKIWDNSIKYNYLKNNSLATISAFKKRKNKWFFYYGQASKFYASEFEKNETPINFDIQRMPVKYADDKIRKSFRESVFNWYEDYFLATGYRQVKNSENENDKSKRDVFYLAKFKF